MQFLTWLSTKIRTLVVDLTFDGLPRTEFNFAKAMLKAKGGELLGPTEITLKRPLTFNETQVLAKDVRVGDTVLADFKELGTISCRFV